MIYEITGSGLKNISVHENEAKNNLPIGTVLRMSGYNEPVYCIVKNLGISERFSGYGATYLTVNIADYGQSQHQAYTLKHISEKKDERIQVYITDEVLTPDNVLILWEKSEGRRLAIKETQERKAAHLAALEAQGRELFKKHIPNEAQALIIAVRDENQSDIQTDYFAHTETATVILGWSKHKRDLFSEMRKHAVKIPETAHLGPGCGHFEPRVIVDNCQIVPGYTHYSQWHSELHRENGWQLVFRTKAEAQAHIDKMGLPYSITFNGVLASFHWDIEEDDIEQREKYSMGQGYYLKDGGGHGSGWRVEKRSKYGTDWDSGLYVAMAKRCIF